MLAGSNAPEQAKSCDSVSYLMNTQQIDLLHLQPGEPIPSESVCTKVGKLFRNQKGQ